MKLMDGLAIMDLRDDMATMDETAEGALSGEASTMMAFGRVGCAWLWQGGIVRGDVRLRLAVCE